MPKGDRKEMFYQQMQREGHGLHGEAALVRVWAKGLNSANWNGSGSALVDLGVLHASFVDIITPPVSFAACSITYWVFIYAEIYFYVSLLLAAEKLSSLPVIPPAFTSHCLLLAFQRHKPMSHTTLVWGFRFKKHIYFCHLIEKNNFLRGFYWYYWWMERPADCRR